MIYIFEDRAERKRQHQEIVTRYQGKICFAKFDIDEDMNLEDYIINNFLDAKIIIFHKSYSFKSKTVNLEEIKKKMKMNRIRFVVFSGGIENGSINSDGNVEAINADVMYNNLEVFLKFYEEDKEINFEPLVWGEHYKLNQQLSLQDKLFREYFITTDLHAKIDNDDLRDILEDIFSMCEEYRVEIKEHLTSESKRIGENCLTWGDLLHIILTKISTLNTRS